MDTSSEEKRLAIEVISTLVNIKKTMVELILKPAGVPSEVYGPLLAKRDDDTGKTISKRRMAALLLSQLDSRGGCASVVRRLIEIAAQWNSFHLAYEEYEARATVQKAKELVRLINVASEQEAIRLQAMKDEEAARRQGESAAASARERNILLMMLDELSNSSDEQARGYYLQDFLQRVFDLHGISVVDSFKRNQGGEQIDGAFKLEGWHYLVECRWRKKLSDIRELDGLLGQIQRSGKQTMGLFLSINGWSENVPLLLKQNREKSIILMEGYGLRTVLDAQLDLRDFLLAMLADLNLHGEPFLSVADYLRTKNMM